MLYITVELEEIKDKVRNLSAYFDAVYEVSWLNNPLAKDIIKGIDSSIHIKDNLIESPVYGGISPRDLSGGCKGVLLLLNEPGIIACGEAFGDNCFYWLGRAGEVQDIHVTMHHHLFSVSKDEPLTACITNINKVVNTSWDLGEEIYKVSSIRGYKG